VLARDMSWMELSNVEELSAGYGVLNVAAMQRCAHSKLDPIGRLLFTIWFTPPMAESASTSRNESRQPEDTKSLTKAMMARQKYCSSKASRLRTKAFHG
jgi:hypothetical protein